MHGFKRPTGLVRRRLHLVIVLPLLVAFGQAHAVPDAPPPSPLDIPTPATMTPVSSPSPEVAQFLRAMHVDPADLKALYSAPPGVRIRSTSDDGGKDIVNRIAFAVPLSQEEQDALPPAVFDKRSDAGQKMAKMRLLDLQVSANLDPNVHVDSVRYLDVFRQEPWGVFYSANILRGTSLKPTDLHVFSTGIVKVHRTALALYVVAPFHDFRNREKGWTETSVSAWADAVHKANPVTVPHSGIFHRIVPWLILAILLLMAYFLFFKKSKPS